MEVHGEIVGLRPEGGDAAIPTDQGQSLSLIDPVKGLNVVVFLAAAEKARTFMNVHDLYKHVSYKFMYLCTLYYCSINIIFLQSTTQC